MFLKSPRTGTTSKPWKISRAFLFIILAIK